MTNLGHVVPENENELLRRYAEHTPMMMVAAAGHMASVVADPATSDEVRHGLWVRLVGEVAMSIETLAAWICAFETRGTLSPSFFAGIVGYNSRMPRELWREISSMGWDRGRLRLPDDTTLKAALAATSMADDDGAVFPDEVLDAAMSDWSIFDAEVEVLGRFIASDTNGVYQAYLKAKHGLAYTWNYRKHGGTLQFAYGKELKLVASNCEPDQAAHALRNVSMASRAVQKLAVTAWALGQSGLLYGDPFRNGPLVGSSRSS